MRCTCIIPFFNERKRIARVLGQLVKIKAIDEIIAIDDGSTDGSSEVVTKQFPHIKIIRNAKNFGKTEAIRTGVKKAKGEYIILVDADLRDLNYREVERAVNKMFREKVDMIILRHIHALKTMKFVRGDILISGERILSKKDLQKVLQRKVTRFQLEAAINKYMFDNKKSVYWVPSSARNTYKFTKIGIVKGWYEMIMVAVDIILYLGLKDYLRQLVFFCRKELV